MYQLFQMLFSSKKVNTGLGYSVIILIANIIFILIGTFVFVHIEGKVCILYCLAVFQALGFNDCLQSIILTFPHGKDTPIQLIQPVHLRRCAIIAAKF
jgi:hypothetical protein